MKKTWKLLLALALVVSLCGGCAYLPLLGLAGGTSGADLSSQVTESEDGDTVTISKEFMSSTRSIDTLIELQKQVDQYYYQETDEQTMLDGAAQGLLLSLGDPYTFYYTPEEYAKLWEDDEGSYAGVGMQISGSYATGVCTISRVFDGQSRTGRRACTRRASAQGGRPRRECQHAQRCGRYHARHARHEGDGSYGAQRRGNYL